MSAASSTSRPTTSWPRATCRGSTGDGQRYQTAWVRYDHKRGLLYTDAPVAMEDASGSFRGDGFRYDTRKKSFRLLGNVSVVQKP